MVSKIYQNSIIASVIIRIMEKKKDRFNKTEKNRWAGLTLSLCLAILFYMTVSNLDAIKGIFNAALAIMASVIIGAVIAFIVNPLAVIFDRRLIKHFTKHKRWAWVISCCFDNCHHAYPDLKYQGFRLEHRYLYSPAQGIGPQAGICI